MKTIIVTSSIELTPAQKQALEAGIRAKESEELLFEYKTDDIVGGITISDGHTVLDASVERELHNILKRNRRLIHRTVKKGIPINEIPKTIKEKLDSLINKAPEEEGCGKVVSAADGVIRVEGLKDCQYGELLLVGNHGYALAMNLEEEIVGAILLSDIEAVEYGDMVYTTRKIIEVPVGDELLGRVVNALGEPIDNKPSISYEKTRVIESDAPRIIDRQKVNEPLWTGILSIDSMVPIGKGQRELIIGDRQTGKTSICVDTILNQRDKDVICVYVAIGQRASAVRKLIKTLEDNGAMHYTVVVLATASDSAPLQYIAPYTGCAIAEEFMESGKDVLIIYDDISKHAVAYRTISLLLKRPSGREAYPGDIFYIHSRLLERAAKLKDSLGGGSMTALPIVETQAGDISAYIPTNVISITDGQIYLEKELFNAGQRPAINVGLSVSRVGGAAQTAFILELSSQLRLDIDHYRELAVFAQFGASIDPATRELLESGVKIEEALRQPEGQPLSPLREAIYLYAIVKGHVKGIPAGRVRDFLDGYFNYVLGAAADVCKTISLGKKPSEAERQKLDNCALQYALLFK
jgi:F-type H+-transporting ATPase subunit alpha